MWESLSAGKSYLLARLLIYTHSLKYSAKFSTRYSPGNWISCMIRSLALVLYNATVSCTTCCLVFGAYEAGYASHGVMQTKSHECKKKTKGDVQLEGPHSTSLKTFFMLRRSTLRSPLHPKSTVMDGMAFEVQSCLTHKSATLNLREPSKRLDFLIPVAAKGQKILDTMFNRQRWKKVFCYPLITSNAMQSFLLICWFNQLRWLTITWLMCKKRNMPKYLNCCYLEVCAKK